MHMILLSGMTASAVAVIFGIIFIATLVAYFIVYRILVLSDDIKQFFKQLRDSRKELFYASHVALYILSCLLLFGILSLKDYLIN